MLHKLHTLCFEASESGGVGDDVDLEAPGSDDDLEPAAEASPTIDYSAPEFQDAFREAAREEFGALLQGLAQQAPEDGGEQVEFDPYGDPQGFQGYMQQLVQQSIRSELSTIQPTVEAFQAQQNQARVEEMAAGIPEIKEAQELLGALADDLPENYASRLTQYMATGYLRDLEERHGPGPNTVNRALKMAAADLKQFAKASHDAGYQARNNELHGLSGAPAPSPAAAESVQLENQPANEMEAAERYIARRNLQ